LTRASTGLREAKPVAAAEPAVTDPTSRPRSSGGPHLDITLERRQRRLDDDLDPELFADFPRRATSWFRGGAAMRTGGQSDNPALATLQRVLQHAERELALWRAHGHG